MKKESFVLVFGTALSIVVFIGLKAGHFYAHGLCNCLLGKLFEYVIPTIGLVFVIFLTIKVISRLIKQREVASENVKKAYEAINGVSRITDEMLFNFQLKKAKSAENYLKIIGAILETEAVKLKNKATASFLTFRNKQNNNLEGNVIHIKNEDMVVDNELIKIDINSKVAITKGMSNVKFSNWDSKSETLEKYQENFCHKVRQKVGIIKNFITYRFRGVEEGAIIFFNYENEVDQYDADVVKVLASHFGSLYSLSVKQKEAQTLQYLVMGKLADLAEKRDPETGKHLSRVQNYCHFIAETLSVKDKYKDQIDDIFVDGIYNSSPLHDIGKVGINDNVLLKPGKLTKDEMTVMKTHALIGAETLKGPAFLKVARDIANYHHEKWDGTGYPEGLMGEEIPLSARIMAIADVYDALSSKRVYKEAFSLKITESIIKEGIGSHFDPDVGRVFIEHSKKFVEIRKRFQE